MDDDEGGKESTAWSGNITIITYNNLWIMIENLLLCIACDCLVGRILVILMVMMMIFFIDGDDDYISCHRS